jgi:predicted AlkP superfamily phosphohydrolase/phosphomutase
VKSQIILSLAIMLFLPMALAENPKVLVVGWDGADWHRIQPILDEMPNLRALHEKGQWGNLTSTLPTISPAAWTSIATGMNPGEHGIFNFLDRDTLSPVTSKDVKADAVWNMLGARNLSIAAINVPQTYPPSEVNGVLVGGYLSVPGTVFTYPAALSKTLEKGGYQIEAMNQDYSRLKKQELLEHLELTVDRRTEFAKELIEQQEFDFFMIVYTGLDRLQHYFWGEQGKYKDAISDHYKKLDLMLGDLIDAYGPDYVIIISDHGFEGLKGELYTNNVLKELGYLKLKERPGFLARVGLTQQVLRQWADHFPPLEWLRLKLNTNAGLPKPGFTNIDTKASKAYTFGYGGQVYINAGADEYEEIKANIIKALLKIEDNGQQVVKAVHESSEILHGSQLKKAPDLIIECPGYDAVGFLGYKRVLNTGQIKSGTHAIQGVYVLSGPNIQSKQQQASLLDIAPTVLALYDLNADMDGESLI